MKPDASNTVQTEAAEWDARVRAHDCNAHERGEFERWLVSDSNHQLAYDQLQSALAALRSSKDHPALLAMREHASMATRRVRQRRRFIGGVIAASLGGVVLAFALGKLQPHFSSNRLSTAANQATALAPTLESWATESAERRTLSLRDGTSVTLNGATQVSVDWTGGQRRFHLVRGQALFHVAKDPARPFVVSVADRTVTALGTTFDVRVDDSQVRVTLLEGRVAIRGTGRSARLPVVELTPSQQLTARSGEAPTVEVVDPVQVSGWAEGRIYFADETLASAVEQMNAYSSQKILVPDRMLAQYRINGMFRVGNQDGFVGAITAYYPGIEIVRTNSGQILLRAKVEHPLRQ